MPLLLEGVGVNWTRSGFLRILERMGAIVLVDDEPDGSFSEHEPVADLDRVFDAFWTRSLAALRAAAEHESEDT